MCGYSIRDHFLFSHADNIHLEMVMMLEKGKMMLQKHLEKFVKEGKSRIGGREI